MADQAVFGLEIEIGFGAFFVKGGRGVDLDFEVLVGALGVKECVEVVLVVEDEGLLAGELDGGESELEMAEMLSHEGKEISVPGVVGAGRSVEY